MPLLKEQSHINTHFCRTGEDSALNFKDLLIAAARGDSGEGWAELPGVTESPAVLPGPARTCHPYAREKAGASFFLHEPLSAKVIKTASVSAAVGTLPVRGSIAAASQQPQIPQLLLPSEPKFPSCWQGSGTEGLVPNGSAQSHEM